MSSSSEGRGFLTESDRKYLRGETKYAQPAGERRKRRDIRERTWRALQDFAFILQYLEPRDRIQILDEFALRDDEIYAEATDEEPRKGPPESRLDILFEPDEVSYGIHTGGLRSMQGFIALLLYDFCDDIDFPEKKFQGLFAELVREGLRDAFAQVGVAVDVELELNLETQEVDFEELRSRFEEDPEALTEREVKLLSHARAISWEEYRAYFAALHR